MRRFSESFGEEAGAHFTSLDIIYLMTDLLLSDADLTRTGNVTVYDMTMGTSQMLTCMEERLKQLDKDADVTVFGHEFNPFTFGIAKANMLIRGGAAGSPPAVFYFSRSSKYSFFASFRTRGTVS